MKKIIFVLITMIVLCSSIMYAMLYDPNEEHVYDNNLPYNDLQIHLYKNVNNKEYRTTKEGEPLYCYHRYLNEILKATTITIDKHGKKLVEGYEDGSFKPDGNITRAEFIKMAISMSNNRSFDYTIFPNPDPADGINNHWAAPYVVVAEMQDVIDVGDINYVNIDEPISRMEVIKIISKIQINMKDIPQFRDGFLPNYIDTSLLKAEEKELLLHATKYDLIEGLSKIKEGETWNPDILQQPITRAEAVRALLRVY